jgi:hypothetical protein
MTYCFTQLPFGLTSSPFLLPATLKEHADRHKVTFPMTAPTMTVPTTMASTTMALTTETTQKQSTKTGVEDMSAATSTVVYDDEPEYPEPLTLAPTMTPTTTAPTTVTRIGLSRPTSITWRK